MNVEFRLVQYHPDIQRQEGRNVAVIAWDGVSSVVRALGVGRRGKVNTLLFEKLMPPGCEPWANCFLEWVERWSHLVKQCGGDGAAIEAELQQLAKESCGQFVPVGGGTQFDYDPPSDSNSSEAHLRKVAAQLYDELVLGDEAGHVPVFFFDAVDRAIRTAGIEKVDTSTVERAEGLRRHHVVEVTTDGHSATPLFFPYYLDRSVPLGIKQVCFQGPNMETMVSAANDAIFTFSCATAAGLLRRDRCIVLADPAVGLRCQHLSRRVGESATIINVYAKDAGAVLRSILDADS